MNLSKPFTGEEMDKATELTEPGRTAGTDGILPDFLKNLHLAYTLLYQYVWPLTDMEKTNKQKTQCFTTRGSMLF